MNTGEHITAQGEHVHDEQNGHHPALTELRRRLSSGLARLKLNQTQLAGRAHLGRTTVSEAFQVNGPVPSPRTVTALARALKLPVEELLELQRTAEAESGSDGPDQSGPGKPIDEWEPHDLEVHPAGAAPDADDGGTPGRRLLPEYVRREHDRAMADAVRDAAAGHSRMVVLVGSSSTGKTRTCWEAVQPLATKEWRLWHPFDPTRADAALEDLHRVQPRTVVWLNEAQHYLGDPGVGERIAAALHSLLIQPDRGPVLVLGTLWPEYVDQYTLLPEPGTPDPHSRVRELLAGRTVTVPEAFDEQALAAAAVLADAGDRLLAEALTRARADGRLTQDLAGAPALLHRYEHGSPAAKAVLEAAMDARRLGVGLRLPQAFLTEAATDYLSDTDYDQLTEDWAEAAFAELARPVHGKQAPLRRTTLRPQRRTPGTPAPATSRSTESPVYRLADYLEQHGRAARRPLCPPASFWQAAHTHLTHPNDLGNLATQALNRHRLLWAHHLDCRAADAGHTGAQVHLAQLREKSGDREGAEALYRQAADAGDSSALHHLAMAREVARDREGALALACRATDAGNEITLHALALVRSKIGDWEGVEALCRQAVAAGHTSVLVRLAEGREKGGDLEGAEVLYRQAVEAGDRSALLCLAKVREKGGDLEGAEVLYRQAVEAGDRSALLCLAKVR
ncbi:helix-turn-helix domain-containing protein, partial [Streptomyces sp. NPDC002132]|uniref:helix-turn-helix domain-containing protein n=2 Tax=unclassified Streptomyces TaxID=2593676 RepID=UPI00331E031F